MTALSPQVVLLQNGYFKDVQDLIHPYSQQGCIPCGAGWFRRVGESESLAFTRSTGAVKATSSPGVLPQNGYLKAVQGLIYTRIVGRGVYPARRLFRKVGETEAHLDSAIYQEMKGLHS